MNIAKKIKGAFFGQAIGDALGVPIEFKPRSFLEKKPIKDLEGYKVWDQPPGTFSDDSSMMFCTAESLISGFDINDIAHKFTLWYQQGYWGAHNECFDIGGTTRRALERIIKGETPSNSGGFEIFENGNGSLMRIVPMVFELMRKQNIDIRFQKTKEVSSITHAHLRSVLSCFIYNEYCIELLKGKTPENAYAKMQKTVNDFISKKEFNPSEIKLFDRILKQNIYELKKAEVNSMGYVLDSLESSFWCFLTTDNYKDAVLKAVNLGGDTDTTGAITGAIAGLHYGFDAIPKTWVERLIKTEEINDLAKKFIAHVNSNN